MKNANPKMLDKLKDKFTTLKNELVTLSKALPPVKPPVVPPVAPVAPAPAAPVVAPAAPVVAPAAAPTPAAPVGASSSLANKFVPSKPISAIDAAKNERLRQQKTKEITVLTGSGQTSTSPRATGIFKPNVKFGDTASGKNIMHGSDHASHENFTAEDHADASRQFLAARKEAKMDPTVNPKVLDHLTEQATYHDKRMRDLKAAGPTPMSSRTYTPTKG